MLCHVDPHISRQRVQGRYALADDDKKVQRDDGKAGRELNQEKLS